MEEDSVTSNDKSKADAAETNNGFAELNGGQDTHEIFPAINFEELTNSNSMYDENVPDPLAVENTKDTANSNSLVEPMEVAQDPTNSTVEEGEKDVNSTANENVCDNENITTAVNENALANIPEANENFTSHPQDIASEVQMSLDALVTKEEPELMDYGATGETEIATGIGTIANVFTDVVKEEPSSNTRTLEKISKTSKLKKALFNSIDRASKRIIKSVGKQARSLTSPEYLWFLIQLVPKCPNNSITDEKTQLQGIIEKRVSEVAKKTISDLLERVENFTPTEYSVLFQKLGDRRKKDKPVECIKEFNQSIMWFKTHLEVEPEYIMAKTDVFNGYTSYCSMQSMNPLKISEFVSFLRTLYPTVKERRRDSKGLKRYFYTGIKMRTVLHPPKLPKFAEDQLHNNKLLSQYMSCHDCCAFYSSLVLEKTPQIGQQKIKIKIQNPQLKSTTLDSNKSSIVVDDPLDLLNVKETSDIKYDEEGRVVPIVDLSQDDEPPVRMKQVAKKSVFPRGIKRIGVKYREYKQMTSGPSTTKFNNDGYTEKLLNIKEKLSKFIIIKTDESSMYKVLCICCQYVFYVSEQNGQELLSAQEKLRALSKNPKTLSKWQLTYHPSIQNLYYSHDKLILPKRVVHRDVAPVVSINRFEVHEWYMNQISTLKRKLLDSALNALNCNSRRNRYEPKVPFDSSHLITHRPTQITPPYPPIYISAVREPTTQMELHKTAEVYNRHTTQEPGVIEISAQKNSKPTYTVPHYSHYSRNRYMPYNRRKESDYMYFPTIDTSPDNLRLTGLGTLYQCILCLMLFNTEEKLHDHEQNHLHCNKCKKKYSNVEVMRQHLIIHCERNYKKRKPILKIHRVDTIAIMVKKYGGVFAKSVAYYKSLKPKKKYREMRRPTLDSATPAIEQVFVSDIKPDIIRVPEIPFTQEQPDYNISLEMLVDVKQELSSNIPAIEHSVQETPYISMNNARNGCETMSSLVDLPKLIPLTSTIKNKKVNKGSTSSSTPQRFKVRVKDLMELN